MIVSMDVQYELDERPIKTVKRNSWNETKPGAQRSDLAKGQEMLGRSRSRQRSKKKKKKCAMR